MTGQKGNGADWIGRERSEVQWKGVERSAMDRSAMERTGSDWKGFLHGASSMSAIIRNAVGLVLVAATLCLIYEVIEVGLSNGEARQEQSR